MAKAVEPAADGGDDWLKQLRLDAFHRDVNALGEELRAGEGEEDRAHLDRVVWVMNTLFVSGAILLPLPVWYLLPAVLIAFATSINWACVAHHAQHGGYMRCDPSGRYHRGTYGMGLYRRIMDWSDWMLPEAWDEEHNRLHHYHTNEKSDPDLVEDGLAALRRKSVLGWLPRGVKWVLIFVMACIWKPLYYASNTWKTLVFKRASRERDLTKAEVKLGRAWVTIVHVFLCPRVLLPIEFTLRVVAPYVALRFVLPVLLWNAVAGEHAALNALGHLVVAEVLANVHGFVIIACNHAGNDLYRFDTSVTPLSAEFFLRQVISGVDFHTGADVARAGRGEWLQDACDLAHGWLNYQIEHHLFPNLSMLSYRRAQPRVRALCRQHGVPYVQDAVWVRVGKLVDIMTGDASMRRFPGLPASAPRAP